MTILLLSLQSYMYASTAGSNPNAIWTSTAVCCSKLKSNVGVWKFSEILWRVMILRLHTTLALYVVRWRSRFYYLLFFLQRWLFQLCPDVALFACVCLMRVAGGDWSADVKGQWKNSIPHFSKRGHAWRYRLLCKMWEAGERERERLIAERGWTNNLSSDSF